MLAIIASLGVVHLSIIIVSLLAFTLLIGLFDPSSNEPYPRVSQLSFPSSSEKSFYLMHVSKTALKKQWYVSSISQFVSCRGTTSAKLMMWLCSSLCLSGCYIQSLLWSEDKIGVATLVLTILSQLGLGTLGWCESALEWDPLPVDYPELESATDKERMNGYYNSLQITRLTKEEDSSIKTKLASVHLVSAFVFILCQFAGQVVLYHEVQNIPSVVVAVVGMGLFLVFCMLQWCTGASDQMIQACTPISKFAISNLTSFQCLYFPQNGTLAEPILKRVSWMFLVVEITSFTLMACAPAVNALCLTE
jgi:hypothetical protein